MDMERTESFSIFLSMVDDSENSGCFWYGEIEIG
jgi:hypothetical protein